MVRQRRRASAYEQGNRLDLAQQEAEEIAVIERLLPSSRRGGHRRSDPPRSRNSAPARSTHGQGDGAEGKYSGQMDFCRASAMVAEAWLICPALRRGALLRGSSTASG
jgi:uncharacterized protein YqeY